MLVPVFQRMGINRDYSDETFGERVRRLREAKGLTQGELGALVGYKGNLPIYNIERGETKAPRGPKLGKLAKALGTTVEYLLEGAEAEEGVREESRVEYEVAYPSLREFLEKTPDVTREERAFLESQRFYGGDIGNDAWWVKQLKEYRRLRLRQAFQRDERPNLTDEHPKLGIKLKRTKSQDRGNRGE